jgi:hypothetical protein
VVRSGKKSSEKECIIKQQEESSSLAKRKRSRSMPISEKVISAKR